MGLPRGALTVVVLVTSVQVIGTGLATGIESAGDDPFFWVVSLAVGLATAAVMLVVVVAVAGNALSHVTAGWLGLAVGKCPHGYGRGDANRFATAMGLALAGISAGLGVWLWSAGIAQGEPFRAGLGLLTAVIGFVVLMAIFANIFLAIPALSLAISAVVIMLMSGFILYDTGRMIHGGETNYIMATIGLYLAVFNIFIHP